MGESEVITESSNERTISKRWKLVLIGILVGMLFCFGAVAWFERPHYIELNLPTEGTNNNWHDHEQHIVYSWRGEVRHYYIWQNLELFDNASSVEIANQLDASLKSQGWSQNSDLDNFGYIRFNPCQQLYEDGTDVHCQYYVPDGLDPEMRAWHTVCALHLAALYIEYSEAKQHTVGVVTTIQASAFSLIHCML